MINLVALKKLVDKWQAVHKMRVLRQKRRRNKKQKIIALERLFILRRNFGETRKILKKLIFGHWVSSYMKCVASSILFQLKKWMSLRRKL